LIDSSTAISLLRPGSLRGVPAVAIAIVASTQTSLIKLLWNTYWDLWNFRNGVEHGSKNCATKDHTLNIQQQRNCSGDSAPLQPLNECFSKSLCLRYYPNWQKTNKCGSIELKLLEWHFLDSGKARLTTFNQSQRPCPPASGFGPKSGSAIRKGLILPIFLYNTSQLCQSVWFHHTRRATEKPYKALEKIIYQSLSYLFLQAKNKSRTGIG